MHVARILLLFVFLPFNVLFSLDSALKKLNQNHDHGLWLDQFMHFKLPSNWFLIFHGVQRWGADYELLYNYQNELVLQYDLKKYWNLSSPIKRLSLGPGYNLTNSLRKNTKGIYHWVWVNKPIFETYFDFTTCKWQIQNRIRIEYHDFTRKNYLNFILYRYRLSFFTPWKWTSLKINPFFSNEWLFRKNSFNSAKSSGLVGGWYHNRVRIGVAMVLIKKRAKSFLYWQWRIVKHKPNQWKNTYQIGWIINLFF